MKTPLENKGVAWKRDNARDNARCTHAGKEDHARPIRAELDGQHQLRAQNSLWKSQSE